jgi:beta-phosphoglucomutase
VRQAKEKRRSASWLKRLKDAGFQQAIASSAPPANIDALVDELGLHFYFDVVVSGFALPGKPEPTLFHEVPLERCIIVEDAIAGVEAAKRAGMRCVAVTTTNPAEALQAADVVVERLDILPAEPFQRLLKGVLLP